MEEKVGLIAEEEEAERVRCLNFSPCAEPKDKGRESKEGEGRKGVREVSLLPEVTDLESGETLSEEAVCLIAGRRVIRVLITFWRGQMG